MFTYQNKMRLQASQLHDSLRNIRHIALDMDGTIYNGKTLFPFTIPFLDFLKENQIGYSFLTNNPSKSVADYLARLAAIGIKASKEEMYTSAQAAIDYLRTHCQTVKKLFLLGTPSMVNEFEEAGFVSAEDDAEDVPDMLVVGFDSSLTYSRLCRAAWWAKEGIPYIATNPDWFCPTDQPTLLVDCGSLCACIEGASGRKPDIVVGKPNPRMLNGIFERYSLQPREVAMVGDRIYTDVRTAYHAGAVSILVMSGETNREILDRSDLIPDIIAENLAELQEMLRFVGRKRTLSEK